MLCVAALSVSKTLHKAPTHHLCAHLLGDGHCADQAVELAADSAMRSSGILQGRSIVGKQHTQALRDAALPAAVLRVMLPQPVVRSSRGCHVIVVPATRGSGLEKIFDNKLDPTTTRCRFASNTASFKH